jgi:hypothetical protein
MASLRGHREEGLVLYLAAENCASRSLLYVTELSPG